MMPQPQRPAPTNNVTLKQRPNPYTFSPQQTGATYNYNMAQAVRQGDARAAGKQYQRAGMSSSKGTQYLGAADASNAYSQGMANAEAARMQDAYANANMQLQDQVERDRYSNALVGLQEQAAQQQWQNDFSTMNNAMGFMGNLMGGGGGGGGGMFGGGMFGFNPQTLLSGLL